MSALKRVGWAVPIALGALTLALIVAVVVARQERPSRALLVATPGILNSDRGTPPEIAAINQQLAQIAALNANATYGAGLSHVVPSPVPSLRPALGDRWHQLEQSVGRVWVRPTGRPSRYFEFGTVVVSQRGPARVAILTSEGERAVEPVRTGPFQVTNFGPLLTPLRGGVGLAITSVQPQSDSPGPSVVLSPFQAEYLSPGQWVTGMPALSEVGPGGLRGLYLAVGSTTQFAMTPGISGRCAVALQGASLGDSVRVTVTVGGEVRAALLSSHPTVVDIGPLPQTASSLSLSVSMPAGKSTGSVFISDMRFVVAPHRAHTP